ncbi:MAG: hypothetical protein RL386_213 [Bacteroidota bacterium]
MVFYHKEHKVFRTLCGLCGFLPLRTQGFSHALWPLWFFTTKNTKISAIFVAFVVIKTLRTQGFPQSLWPLWFFTTKDTRFFARFVSFVVIKH